MTPDPWAVGTAAEATAAQSPLKGVDRFDDKAHFEAVFREAVMDTVAMQAVAWGALVECFGSATALQLAPVLLPSLLESASHEALAKTRQAIQDFETRRALREARQIPTGQPW